MNDLLEKPLLETDRLHLRLPEQDDSRAIAAYYERNQTHLAPSGTVRLPDFISQDYWWSTIPKFLEEFEKDAAVRLIAHPNDDSSRIIASINFSQIFRGGFQACYLGYSIDGSEQGKGFMGEALLAATRYMFLNRNMHRIMANYLPENHRSGKVLDKLGFIKEGLAKDYLKINNVWRDHVLTSLTNPNWKSN